MHLKPTAFTLVLALSLPGFAAAQDVNLPSVVVYKNPWCGCCAGWVKHMRDNGFTVAVNDVEDLDPIKASMKVPSDLQSCHTAKIANYTIEGHVPSADILRLLDEKPVSRGLSVPGMVAGSPGMAEGDEPYQVVLFADDGSRSVFASY
jgi:hypothetical protein